MDHQLMPHMMARERDCVACCCVVFIYLGILYLLKPTCVIFLPVLLQPLIYVPSHCNFDVAFRGRHRDTDENGSDVFEINSNIKCWVFSLTPISNF